jgi:hypothetical protein
MLSDQKTIVSLAEAELGHSDNSQQENEQSQRVRFLPPT